ncbi:site-specific integrase [Luteolibacter ambystomatis]|uniref:Site-specific integrase n=1 Tax=Luteolibacter ambystomatis TaxID=2824561 RepID=A0A975PGD1_9BACT|nr:site-specific integrase [Luteolibacter ambystomatis]QUE52629.1 site-specific integrase [Luteolibacter ambystomatis]
MGKNHLIKRGSRYFFRRRVPEVIQAIVGKKELKAALGTSDFKEAVRKATVETLKSDEQFEAARRALKSVHPGAPAKRRVGYSEAMHLLTRWYQELENGSLVWFEENHGIRGNPDELRDVLEGGYTDLAAYSGERHPNDGCCRKELRSLIEDAGVEFGGTDDEFTRLSGLMKRGRVLDLQKHIARLEGTGEIQAPQMYSGIRHEKSCASGFPSSSQPVNAPSVGDVIDEFLEARKLNDRTDATLRAYAGPTNFLRSILGGSTPIANVDRAQMKEVLKLLVQFPANAAKHYPGKPALRCIELAKADGRKAISANTLKNYLICVRALFNFAVEAQMISVSPLRGISFPGRGVKGGSKRPLFTVDEVNRLFRHDFYNDNEARRKLSLENVPGRFWVPLIALFHGCRSNEICQLYTDDVFEKDGILCINISDERADGSSCEKRLKTQQSKRLVPVHPTLLEIGFKTFWKQRGRDQRNPRLFHDLTLGKNGNYSDAFQKHFHRFLSDCFREKMPKATLHSFRHMWKDAATEAGIPEEVARRLGGWVGDRSAAAGYGRGPSVQKLFEAVQRIEFPGLKIDHIRWV